MKVLKTDQYDRWLRGLKDVAGRARINARIRRIELVGDLLGDWKAVGGAKSTQQADIRKAQELLVEWEGQNGG